MAGQPTKRGMKASVHQRQRLRGEGGFILIEVMISAVLLVTVSLAVFSTLDKSDALAGNQQARSIAGNVAQSEIERLRSLPIDDIAHIGAVTQPVIKENGTTYTIKNVSKWVTDGGDEPDCTTRKGGLDYMRVTTSVTWTKQGQAKPVRMTSYITPATQGASKVNGALSIRIVDRNGAGVPSLSVSIVGPVSYTEVTNSTGCVVFPSVPASNAYLLKYQRVGWVDADGNGAISSAVSVSAGQTRKIIAQYDQGGTTQAQFVTYRAGSTADVTSYPKSFVFAHALRPAGEVVTQLSGSNVWNDGSDWFPFTSPYAIYPGSCTQNAPPNSNPDSSSVTILPGGGSNVGNVTVPSLDVSVYSGMSAMVPGTLVGGARVKVDTGCLGDTTYYSRTTSSAPALLGRLDDPGFPYSANATVCVSANIAGNNRKWTQTGVSNTAVKPRTQTVYPVYLGALKIGNPSVTSGTC